MKKSSMSTKEFGKIVSSIDTSNIEKGENNYMM